jgi:hypothetical protein
MISRPARALAQFLFFWLVAALSLSAQTSLPEVSVSGSLSAHTILEDERLQFTVTVKNKADAKTNPGAALQDLRLQELPAGYSLDSERPVCVLPLAPPQPASCRLVNDFDANKFPIMSSLAPGQSVTIQGYLKPGSPRKSGILTAVVAWGVAGTNVPSSQPVSLGESQVQGSWHNFLVFLLDLLKLLFIPFVLAVIGWWLNRINKEQDDRKAEKQEERQAAQHQHELEQAALQRQHELAQAALQRDHEAEEAVRAETWKQMLLLSHTYAAKCYLPLSLAADRAASSLRDLLAHQGDERIAFFYILMCGREMTNTRRETGGLYFKDLRGEILAGECWRRQREALIGTDEESRFNLAVRYAVTAIDGLATYADFKRRFEVAGSNPVAFNHPDIQDAWTRFLEWAANHPDLLAEVARYMEGLTAVLDYESNRPYKYWYDTKPRLIATQRTEQTLREVLQGANYSSEQVKDYLSAVERP